MVRVSPPVFGAEHSASSVRLGGKYKADADGRGLFPGSGTAELDARAFRSAEEIAGIENVNLFEFFGIPVMKPHPDKLIEQVSSFCGRVAVNKASSMQLSPSIALSQQPDYRRIPCAVRRAR